MKPRLIRVAKLASYPLFYLAALVVFGYLCFPFDQLKSRIIAEFDRLQQAERRRAPSSKAAMRLELGELDSYWLSGIEVREAKLTIPPDTKTAKKSSRLPVGTAKSSADEEPPKPSVITVDRAHARVRLLPLLLGRVRVDFGLDAFGGEIYGSLPYGADGDVEVTIEDLQLGEVQPLQALTGLPVLGTVNGELRLVPKEAKFSKADGKLELTIQRVVIGDGKAKLQGVALPAAQVGDFAISADAKDGVLKIDEITATGRDFELTGDGRVRIRENWNRSRADIYLKFRFTDGYRDKNDTTRSLLGEPGSKAPAILEFEPRIKRSKTADGFYGWQVHGPLADLKFDPKAVKGTGRSRSGPRKPGTTTKRTTPDLANRLKGRLGRGKRTTPSTPVRSGRDSDSPAPEDDDAANDRPPPAAAAPKADEDSAGEEGAAAEEGKPEEGGDTAEGGEDG